MSRIADYETDILEWSEEQASALRSLARTQPAVSNQVDWENVAEEIESVGRSEFAAVKSFVRQILIHLIMAVSDPDSQSLLHWSAEALAFHTELFDHLAPSMRSRIEIARVWQQAVKQARSDLAARGRPVATGLSTRCPLEVADILNPDFDFLKAVENVRRQIADGSPAP
jgi:hypothetical protein